MELMMKCLSLLLLSVFSQCATAAVMFVGWDGADFRVVRELADSGQLPNLNRLTWGRMEIVAVTQTSPSWQEQLSGLPWYVTGCISNDNCKPLDAGKSIFDWLKVHGRRSAFLTGKSGPMGTGEGEVFANIKDSAEIVRNPSLTIEEWGDVCLSYAGSHDFVFCHSKQPDVAGHQFGGVSGKYVEKLLRLDVQLGRYIDAGHTILLSSDHGFEQEIPAGYVSPVIPHRVFPYGYAHIRERNAIVGATVPIDLCHPTELDIFKTLVELLGLPPASWALEHEGRSLVVLDRLHDADDVHLSAICRSLADPFGF